jgi:hypothetical protein
MPNVGRKKYPYTKAGMQAAAAAKKKLASKKKKKSKSAKA